MAASAGPEETPPAAPPSAPQEVLYRRRRSGVRMTIGLIGLAAILIAGGERCVTASLDRSASAVQITQIYTEGTFFVLVVVGALVAFYVAVRPD